MTFNWFNRQFNQPKQEAPPSEPNEAPIAPAETKPAATDPAEADTTASPETTDVGQSDQATAYLNWAKAAYENIRRRQQAEAAAQAAQLEASASEAEPVITEAAARDIDPPITIVDEPIVAENQPEPVVVASEGLDTFGEAANEVANEAASDAVQSTDLTSDGIADSAPAQPFWARAEAERAARLERLRAEAIDLEEAQPLPPMPAPVAETESVFVPTKTPIAYLPDLELDEGFIWSAEVLAAQGRRPETVDLEEITWLKRLRQGLDRTRRNLINQLKAIVGQGPLNQEAVDSIEEMLLQADVGVVATERIIQALQQKIREEVLPPDQAIAYLKQILRDILDRPHRQGQGLEERTRIKPLTPEKGRLNIWLITGVNGVGKTTTIGKLAHIASKSGYSCLIAAADTFRAAAVEQVKVWGQRSQVEVVANPGQNTDPAAVVFDAIAAAQSRGVELLLVDTAGRLQNKKNLMDELSKIRRIIDKKAAGAKIESLLVLDASLGQNGLRQAEVFSKAAQLNGVVLTKLDGTGRGGVALAVVEQLGLPIRFIGAGEGIEDLRPFSSYEFVEALLSD